MAQPDGTFVWLQSFIGHYALQTWMKQQDRMGRRYLSLEQLLELLASLRQLMAIERWSDRANLAYVNLFNVDFFSEDPTIATTWRREHRISRFSWDLACEYPIPGGQRAKRPSAKKKTNKTKPKKDREKN